MTGSILVACVVMASMSWAIGATAASLWLIHSLDHPASQVEAQWRDTLERLELRMHQHYSHTYERLKMIEILVMSEKAWSARYREAKLLEDTEGIHTAGAVLCAIVAWRCELEP